MIIFKVNPELIHSLLNQNQLPEPDLIHGTYWAIGDPPDACIGLEIHGQQALLRSLVVKENMRNLGLAKKLVNHVEKECAEAGLHAIFLLTTTAEHYFLKVGYQLESRDNAPPEIRSSSEFSNLCPASATFMKKTFAQTDI